VLPIDTNIASLLYVSRPIAAAAAIFSHPAFCRPDHAADRRAARVSCTAHQISLIAVTGFFAQLSGKPGLLDTLGRIDSASVGICTQGCTPGCHVWRERAKTGPLTIGEDHTDAFAGKERAIFSRAG